MPQLDIGSYRTQVNALVRTFGRRYRTRAGIALPKVARAIKRRSRKTERGRTQGETGTMQKAQAEDAYGKELGSGLHTASEVLNASRDMHLQWRGTHTLTHRQNMSKQNESKLRKPSKQDIRTKRMGLRVNEDKVVTEETVISKSKKTLAKLKAAKNKRRKGLKKRRKSVADALKALTSGKPKKTMKTTEMSTKTKKGNKEVVTSVTSTSKTKKSTKDTTTPKDTKTTSKKDKSSKKK